MQYAIRRADIENVKEYLIRKHANEDVWEVCDANIFEGSDVLIMVEIREVIEFDCNGQHFCVWAEPIHKKRFSKEEQFRSLGIHKVVYWTFSDEDFVNVTILPKKGTDTKVENPVVKATEIDELTIHKAHCDWVIEQAKELKALLSHNSEKIIKLNKVRALADIATITDSLAELKLYIEEL